MVNLKAIEFTENVFMYDQDRTSSYVTSSVLRIDVKTPTTRVTPNTLNFEQSVVTPEAVIIKPEVDDEDASEFMYHQFIYQKGSDYICLIIEPIGVYNFTSYLVYFKYDASPSLIDYDFKWWIYESESWLTCISPGNMKVHTGITYFAVYLPDTSEYQSMIPIFYILLVYCDYFIIKYQDMESREQLRHAHL